MVVVRLMVIVMEVVIVEMVVVLVVEVVVYVEVVVLGVKRVVRGGGGEGGRGFYCSIWTFPCFTES